MLGASGFIGRHLMGRLAADGWRTFSAAPTDRHGGRPLPEGHVVEISTLDSAGIGAALDAAQPNVVFNLVAAGIGPTGEDPETLVAGNAGIVASLMAALEGRTGVRVIHTGSWSEYADPIADTPVSEEHPMAPSSGYGAAKAGASLLGAALSRRLGIPFLVLRLFNVYGPGEAPHRLLPYLVTQLTGGDPADLTVGTQIRDFLYVGDVVNALLVATTTELETEVFNVATGVGTAIRDIARMTAAELNASATLLRFGALEGRRDEPATIVGDPSRFAKATGWSAQTSLADGVRRTVEGIKSHSARQQA